MPTMEERKQTLAESGFVVLPGFMGTELLEEVRSRSSELYALEGENAGYEFKKEPFTQRLANLVNKGEVFERVIQMPEILELMESVLGPGFKLSSLNIRSADPESEWTQPLHVDGGMLADENGYSVCNSVWLLDDFTETNGATRMVPGSHRWNQLPEKVLADPMAPHPQEQLVLGKAGTVVVMNAHMWHGGTANRSLRPRRAMHVYYTRHDKPQQQYQKALLSEEVQRRQTGVARRILALDDAINDQISAANSGMSGFLK